MSIFSAHLSFEQLVDWSEGRLAPDEQARWQEHLASCSRCANDLAFLRNTIALMQSDDSVDAPPDVIARAIRRFGSKPTPTQASLRTRLAALLTFDSGHMPLAWGVRSTAASSRQLLFSAGEYELDVRLHPEADEWRIAGQVLGPEVSGYLELHTASGEIVGAQLNSVGEFTFPPLASGRYSLTAHIPKYDLEISDLVLGAGA